MAAKTLIHPPLTSDAGLDRLARGLVIATLILFFLYIGQPFLKPLVIAALLSFVLAPIIRTLRRWGLWRRPSVILTVGAALLILGVVASVIVYEITDLARELPKYEATLQTKARELNGAPFTAGALQKESSKLQELGDEIGKARNASLSKPVLVEVFQPEPRGFQSIMLLVSPLISPLTTTGLVILFLLFILLEREDLRDRFLRLAGTRDLHRTTEALDDAGERLSGYFLMQSAVNASFGRVVGLGLAVIGIPHAALWGILAGIFRYVPFVGTLISAFFPTLLAAAIDPGWSSVFWTIGLFGVSELVARQGAEPVLYGLHTGLSAVATVLCTLLWTLLWGPLGLLLATPLTVCLVVFGRHIDAFNFIEVLLGDEPALEPEERFYQRLLAEDAAEASDMAEGSLKEASLAAFYDTVSMRALVLAQLDASLGKLSKEKQREIFDTMSAVVENMDDVLADEFEEAKENPHPDSVPTGVAPAERLPKMWQVPHQVICTNGSGDIDLGAMVMLGQLLRQRAFTVFEHPQADPASKLAQDGALQAPIVCVVHVEASGASSQIRFYIRRLRRRMPTAKFVACLWSADSEKQRMDAWAKSVGADVVVSSLQAVCDYCSAARENEGKAS